VRKILGDRLVQVFGTYKEERHAFQNTASTLVGNTLKTTQGNLQGAIAEAQRKKAAAEAEGNKLNAANDAAVAASDAATNAAEASKTALSDCHNALRDAKAALHDLETAVKTGEADAASAATRKEKLEALINEFFVPVRQGTLDKGLSKSSAWAGKHLGKEHGAHLENEFLVCVVRSFSKPSSAWGTFDKIVDKELDKELNSIKANLEKELAGMEAAKGTRATNVENAKATVGGAEEKVKAAEGALAEATAAAKAAKGAAKEATANLKQQKQLIGKAGDELEDAERKLKEFSEGPLAAYTEVEALAPPPPKPVAEAAAPLVDVAMQAAPPAASRPSPSILSSPGVLLSRMASGVAQATGLASSPRVQQSTPRVAGSPGGARSAS